MTHHILAVDNDPTVTTALSTHLSPNGYHLTIAHDGETAIKRALNQTFDAILLELLLPKKNGFEVLKAIRQHRKTPILLLTTRQHQMDRLIGFNLGADDYIEKPCDPQELMARVQAILKRQPKTLLERTFCNAGGVVLDAVKRVVIKHDQSIELTQTEFNILEMLMRSQGQAFSKAELTEYALGRQHSLYDRSIDVHISHLRMKLGHNARQEPLIKTIRGFGYAFNI